MENNEQKRKIMENVKKYYNQLKFGCYRDICYNSFCQKSRTLRFSNEAEIVSLAIKLEKKESHFCIDLNEEQTITQYNPQFRNVDINKTFETLALNFCYKDLHEFGNIEGLFQNGLNINYPKLKDYFTEYKKHYNKPIEIEYILKYINSNKILKIFESTDEQQTILKRYIHYLLSRLLIYVSLHPFFGFEDYYAKSCFENFFELYLSVNKKLKNSQMSHFLDIFNDLGKEMLSDIINAYQSFISIFLLMEQNKSNLNKIKNLIKIFNIFYKVNSKFKFLNYNEFYNEAMNSDDDLKLITLKSFKTYKKKQNSFSLLKYPWLFDSAFKRDILHDLNQNKQKQEMINSITSGFNSFDTLLNLENNIFLTFEVRREHLIEDTLNIISNSNLNFKKALKVKFVGEQGIDQGGVKKEFFLLLIRQLFDVGYGMFNYYEKTRVFWFNPYSFEATMQFELIGIIFGLAIFNNVYLDVKFPLVVYKKLLGQDPDVDDLKYIDMEHYNSFKYLIYCKDENIGEILQVTFSVTVENFGHKDVIPLKENGENILVNQENKMEYVSLYIDWFFNKSIQPIFKAFKHGFNRVCDESMFKMIRAEELELIICGSEKLDFYELQKVARYEDGYTKDSITMKHLWEVLHDMNLEDKKKFIFFTTGCDRAPINGLGNLIISISRGGPNSNKLPSAHTCFNHLIIPDYQNKEKLKKLLTLAIQNSEGFGLM